MSPAEMWDTPDVVPSITYRDVPHAVEWLERVFGFRERANARLTWPGGAMTWIEIGDGLINLMTPNEPVELSPGHVASGFMIKVYVDDVDAHFAHAKTAGARILSEPETGFWGGRIYRALDQEGHRWEFSQSDRDLAADAWELPPGLTRGVPR